MSGFFQINWLTTRLFDTLFANITYNTCISQMLCAPYYNPILNAVISGEVKLVYSRSLSQYYFPPVGLCLTCVPPHDVSDFMVHRLSWNVNGYYGGQAIPHLLWNLKISFLFHNSSPLDLVLNQANPFYTITYSSFRMHFNIILLTSRYIKWSSPLKISD
jgi:hypothetical protein